MQPGLPPHRRLWSRQIGGPAPSVEVASWGAAILLAAGASRRMGRPKALLPWEDGPLVCYQVERLCGLPVSQVVVVVGHGGDEVSAALADGLADGGSHIRRLSVVLNGDPDAGRAGSIRLGVASTEGCPPWYLLASVDQPLVPPLPEALLARWSVAPLVGAPAVAVPVYQGRRGHPVLLAGWLRDELLAVEEASQGLRAVVQRHQGAVLEVPVDTPVALWNLNTPEDFAVAKSYYLAMRTSEWPGVKG